MPTLYQRLKSCVPTAIREFLKTRLKQCLGDSSSVRCGNLHPVDFRGLIEGPVSALARANGSPVIVEIPLSRCRSFQELGFPITPNSSNPFVMTIQWARATDRDTYKGSPLELYYDTVKIVTGAEKLGIDNSKLSEFPPLYVDAPWRSAPGEVVYQRRANTVRKEVKACSKTLSIKDGWRYYGPMTDSMGCFELQRLLYIFNSIATNGYAVSNIDSHITGNLMLRGTDEWAVWIDNGNHRVSAMASLQYEEVPIILRPRKTIRRSEADKWPAVREGVMTEEEAREVFDRIFEGRQPAAVSAVWPPAGTAT